MKGLGGKLSIRMAGKFLQRFEFEKNRVFGGIFWV